MKRIVVAVFVVILLHSNLFGIPTVEAQLPDVKYRGTITGLTNAYETSIEEILIDNPGGRFSCFLRNLNRALVRPLGSPLAEHVAVGDRVEVYATLDDCSGSTAFLVLRSSHHYLRRLQPEQPPPPTPPVFPPPKTVDVYTNKGGRGPNVFGGNFEIGEEIIIYFYTPSYTEEATLTIRGPTTSAKNFPGMPFGVMYPGETKRFEMGYASQYEVGRWDVVFEVHGGVRDTTWFFVGKIQEPPKTPTPPKPEPKPESKQPDPKCDKIPKIEFLRTESNHFAVCYPLTSRWDGKAKSILSIAEAAYWALVDRRNLRSPSNTEVYLLPDFLTMEKCNRVLACTPVWGWPTEPKSTPTLGLIYLAGTMGTMDAAVVHEFIHVIQVAYFGNFGEVMVSVHDWFPEGTAKYFAREFTNESGGHQNYYEFVKYIADTSGFVDAKLLKLLFEKVASNLLRFRISPFDVVAEVTGINSATLKQKYLEIVGSNSRSLIQLSVQSSALRLSIIDSAGTRFATIDPAAARADIPKPGVIFAREGTHTFILIRESHDDLRIRIEATDSTTRSESYSISTSVVRSDSVFHSERRGSLQDGRTQEYTLNARDGDLKMQMQEGSDFVTVTAVALVLAVSLVTSLILKKRRKKMMSKPTVTRGRR